MYSSFFGRSPNLKLELLERIVTLNYVIDREKIYGFLDESRPKEAIAIYQIEDQLIRRVWIGI